MKRMFMLGVGLLLSSLIFAACDTDKQPYRQYIRAYQRLWQEDSLALNNRGRLVTSENIPGAAEENRTDFNMTFRLVRGEAGDMCIADMAVNSDGEEPVLVRQYFRDGYLYSQNINNPEENYRCPREEDFAMRMAVEGIIEFPLSVIARQSAEQTNEGLLLTFELDSEKFYEYRFPQSSTGYAYGEFQSYREPPLYTALLDSEGRLKQVNGQFCTVNADSLAFTWDNGYTITFSQYGGVELDFPALNDAEFPNLPI